MIFKEALLQELSEILLAKQDDLGEIFLVGGWIRDSLAERSSHDYDFVLKQHPIQAAKTVADHFGGDFYILDRERQTARALFLTAEGKKVMVDCSLLQGGSIAADISQRDFTINAIALNLEKPHTLIDPLGGIEDLSAKRLTPCSGQSMTLDPVRAIRAVRFAQSFELTISPETRQQIKSGSSRLSQISSERIRDEVFEIFSLFRFRGSLHLMDELNILPEVFPEIPPLKEVFPGEPHVHNVFNHAVRVAEIMAGLIHAAMGQERSLTNKFLNEAQAVLERYNPGVGEYFQRELTPNRNIAALSLLSALYHDSAKSIIQPVIKNNRNTYPGHAELGAQMASGRAKGLALSRVEEEFIQRLIAHHMKKEFTPVDDKANQNLFLYRFFRDAKESGVAGCILHLGDVLATYEHTLSGQRWQKALNSVEIILDAWFNRRDVVVEPARLINGDDLIAHLDIQPGKKLGELLEMVREHQVSGSITNREEALEFARRMAG